METANKKGSLSLAEVLTQWEEVMATTILAVLGYKFLQKNYHNEHLTFDPDRAIEDVLLNLGRIQNDCYCAANECDESFRIDLDNRIFQTPQGPSLNNQEKGGNHE